MKRNLVLFTLAWLVVATFSGFAVAQSYVFPGATWENYSNEEIETLGYDRNALRSAQQYIIDSMNTTGLVVVVGGKVLMDFGDTEELSYIASVRKSVLAMLYGKYVENGTIDLEKTLEELGMDDNEGLLPNEKKATIHHLITARSGIYHPASNAGDNSADAPERGSQQPGEYFLYNNWDFNAAGAAFELTTGVNIYDAVQKELAEPLQMEHFDRAAQRKSGNINRSRYRAYHMWYSTRDMARIGYLMLREGNWNGKQIVSKDWAKRIVSVVTPLEEMNPPRFRDNEFGYGYMWWVWDGPQATGPFKGAYTARGAIGQYITVLPALDMVIAHKTNSVYRRSTGWREYSKLMKMIIDAKQK